MGVIDCKILSQIWFVVFCLLATRCCLPVTLIRTLHKLLHVIPDYSSHHPLHWLHTAATGLPSIVCVYYSPSDSNFTEPFHVSWAVPILDFWGPYAKLCRRPGGGGVDETHLSVFHSVSNRARGRRSRNSISSQ